MKGSSNVGAVLFVSNHILQLYYSLDIKYQTKILWKEKRSMIKKQSSMETTVVASDDGKHTFEILRKWDESRRTGIVIELYPTISAEKACEMDLSTMHLMNHVRDFDWGAVRIVNLYSAVFTGKPTASMLRQDMEN